jgi:hypothetical protein
MLSYKKFNDALKDLNLKIDGEKMYDKLYTSMVRSYHNDLLKDLKPKIEEEILKAYTYIRMLRSLFKLNKSKFKYFFLNQLKNMVSSIYNKEVEFKIVNLKNLYLNSDIFTQAISLKLRNRDNRLLRVLRRSLTMVKLPKINTIREKYSRVNKGQVLGDNKYKNSNISSILGNNILDNDGLNQLLLGLFPKAEGLSKQKVYKKRGTIIAHSSIDDYVLKTLIKHKATAGVRLEASGRLTRRFTASKSIFKIR